MTMFWPPIVYLLCLLASLFCAYLLFRAWRQGRSPLLLWTAISFSFLALSNLALVADLIVFPAIYLWPLRFAFTFIALSVLIFGFVWESHQ